MSNKIRLSQINTYRDYLLWICHLIRKLRLILLLTILLFLAPSLFAAEKILYFPIDWKQGYPYDKYMPLDQNGDHGAISCCHLATAMIARYWSLQTELRTYGSFYYHHWDTGEPFAVDFNSSPPLWYEMPSTLSGLDYDDPGVDAIADFIYKHAVACRTYWPYIPAPRWTFHRQYIEVFGKHYGFDASRWRRVQFADYYDSGNWEELYDIIKREIDEGRPIYLRLEGEGGGHSVVIVGYKEEEDALNVYIHFGRHNGLNLSQGYPVNQPIRNYVRLHDYFLFTGIVPADDPNSLPRYHKVEEVYYSQYAALPLFSHICDDDGYACVFPAGPSDSHNLYFVKMNMDGLKIDETVILADCSGKPRKPVLVYGDQEYGLVYEREFGDDCFVSFNLLSKNGTKLLAPDLPLGLGKNSHWRPCADIVFDGECFGIAWASDQGYSVHFCRANSDGDILFNHYVSKGQDPVICFGDDLYCLCWAANRHINYQLFTKNGHTVTEPKVLNPFDIYMIYTPDIVYDGNGFSLVWTGQEVPGGIPNVWFGRISKTGQAIESSVCMITNQNEIDIKGNYPSIIISGDHYLVTYLQGNAFYAIVDQDGNVLHRRDISLGEFIKPKLVKPAAHDDFATIQSFYHYKLKPSDDCHITEIESCTLSLNELSW